MNRVLVMNQFAVPRSVAGGTRHVELFSGLQDWEARIIAGRTTLSGERIESDGVIVAVPVTPYRGNGLDRIVNWASYSFMALVRGLFGRRHGVVYGSSPHMGAGLAALIVARIRRARFVLEVRDLWPQILVETGSLTERSRVFRVLKQLELFLYRRADRVVVLAEGSGRALEDQGVAAEKIVFIPNGADPSAFDCETDRDLLRSRYGFTRFTLVYAGAHGPANGLELVLDAAEELESTNESIDIVLVGDGVSKPALVLDAEQRGLDNLRFLDPVPKAEMPDLLKAADAGLHSLADVELFKSGVSPNKLYDYMAAGLPALTNTGGDTAAMVEQAGSGLAVGPRAIAGGARELAGAGESLRAAMGAAGRQYMEAHRSRRAMIRQLEAMLDELV